MKTPIGLIRDFFPKDTGFSTISNAKVAKVESLLNAIPRKSLGFRSPQEVFDPSLTLNFLCAGYLNPPLHLSRFSQMGRQI
jgi:hypothetical protein